MKDIKTDILGCKVNYADVQAVLSDIRLGEGVQGRLVGTCCVTAEGEKQSRKAVRRALRASGPDGLVFVTGCAARQNPGAFNEMGEKVVVLDGEPSEVASGINAMMRTGAGFKEDGLKGGAEERTRFFLKAQDGCSNMCSYCVIPIVRGRPRSVPLDDILALARAMVIKGCPELVVSGINIGGYKDGDADLGSLLQSLAEIEGLKRLRLSSLEVVHLSTGLLDIIAGCEIIGRHLHLPLQSGDNGILASMGRRYDTAAYEEKIKLARTKVPDINITTDVIVGFPGEDEKSFFETLSFVEKIGFTKVHVFSYSPRPKTKAAEFGDTVSPREKKERSRVIRELSDRLGHSHRRRKQGRVSEVLLESSVGGGMYSGYSLDYTRFVVSGGTAGKLVKVIGESIEGNTVKGKAVADG